MNNPLQAIGMSGQPFRNFGSLLQKSGIYPDILPFSALGALAKGAGAAGNLDMFRSVSAFLKIDLRVSETVVSAFLSQVVKPQLIYDLLYYYMLILIVRLFLSVYSGMNRFEAVSTAPLIRFFNSLVVGYVGFLTGLTMVAGGADSLFTARTSLRVAAPLVCFLVLNMADSFLRNTFFSGRQQISQMGTGHLGGAILLFSGGTLVRYGSDLIGFLKGISH